MPQKPLELIDGSRARVATINQDFSQSLFSTISCMSDVIPLRCRGGGGIVDAQEKFWPGQPFIGFHRLIGAGT